MYKLFICLLVTLTTILPLALAEDREAHYGNWEQYSLADVLKYPDFELRFLGISPGAVYNTEINLRMGDYYKFHITKGKAIQEVVWSSGTGDIGPSGFKIGGQDYMLEMISSYIFDGHVSKDKVMLWPKSEWERRNDERMNELNKK